MLSDCSKCWNTPCTCGWDLRDKSLEYLKNQKRIIDKALDFKKIYPNAVFSKFGEPELETDYVFMTFINE